MTTTPSRISLPEYRKLMFRILFTTFAFLIIYILGIMALVLLMLKNNIDAIIIFMIVLVIFTLLAIPVLIYRTSGAKYVTSKLLNETVTWEFDRVSIKVKGRTFDAVIEWSSINRIQFLNDYVVIYWPLEPAIPISVKAFGAAGLQEFKKMCDEKVKRAH
jgi:hypothetical protein